MKTINKLLSLAVLLLMLASCQKKENLDVRQPVGIGGETWAQGPIDKWLKDSLTTPYNIAVKYRWDYTELQLDRTLTPPDESKILKAMSAVKRVWIDPYNAETGSTLFIKKYSPKQFVLVGSVQYDFGTVTLGQAEGGNNITFFDINQNFDQDSISSIRRMIHTSHHEFAHILHQTVMYPQDFKSITSRLGLPGYTATWFNVSEADAVENGYVTPYAMASPDEDFVETVSVMLMEGKTKFDEIVAGANPTAQQSLRQKEQTVVTYFREVWNIDFYSLQRRVQAALTALVPPPTVAATFGFGKDYTSGQVGDSTSFNIFPSFVTFPASPAFTSIYNSVKAKFAAETPSLTLRSFEVYFNTATTMQVYMYYNANNATANAAIPSTFAVYTYSAVKDASGNYTFTLTSANTNGNARLASANALLSYLNNTFKLEWYQSPNESYYPKVKFTPLNAPNNWFTAAIAP